MNVYPEDYNVEIVVLFNDLNGQPVVPTNVSAKLFDIEDNEVVDFGNLPFDANDGQKSIVISSVFNRLETSELKSARILRVELTTDKGVVRHSHSYIIESGFRLAIAQNTFLSFEAAQLLANDRASLAGWTNAKDNEDRQYAALIEAYKRLTLIPMTFETETKKVVLFRDDWQALTRDEYDDFPKSFKVALREAQLMEANEILQGDTLARKQRAGIVSETIGESSVTIAPRSVKSVISDHTHQHLVGYIFTQHKIARS